MAPDQIMDPFNKLAHNIHDQEIQEETSDNVIPEVLVSEGHPLEPPLDPGDYNQTN